MTLLKKILTHLGHIHKHGGVCYLFYLLKMSIYYQVFLIFNKLISPAKVKKLFQVLLISFLITLIIVSWVYQKQWLYNFLAAICFLCIVCLVLKLVMWVSNVKQIIKYKRGRQNNLFTKWSQWDVSHEIWQAVNELITLNPEKEIFLGSIDNEGRLYSEFGKFLFWENITKSEFVSRYRFPMDLVLINDNVLIKKNFKGNFRGFFNEWLNLVLLSKFSNVPAVFMVDISKTILFKNMIAGRTLRDILVEAGAQILNIQTDNDQDLENLSGSERSARILQRGTEKIAACLPNDFLISMENQLNIIHSRGIAKLSLTFGNIMVDNFNQPWFIDFEGSRYYSSLDDPVFNWDRDQDRKKFNTIYNQNILTFEKVVAQVKNLEEQGAGKYAPVDFGYGLTLGKHWIVDSGTGRWDYLNSKVLSPIIAGKRILDLGSHNGILPLMMAKDGAKEVLGLEMDPQMVHFAYDIQKIMEWRNIQTYNLKILEKDMRAILDEDYGSFDIITAFCSLYYLSEDDMVKIVQKAAELAPIMVLQAKVDTRKSARDNKAQKSSVFYLEHVLKNNGFPEIDIIAPKKFSRPILIGRRIT